MTKCYVTQAKSKAVMERLQPLSAENTQALCSKWLSQTASDAQSATLQLLRSCRNAVELAAAEAKLRSVIQDWKHSPPTDSVSSKGNQASLTAPSVEN